MNQKNQNINQESTEDEKDKKKNKIINNSNNIINFNFFNNPIQEEKLKYKIKFYTKSLDSYVNGYLFFNLKNSSLIFIKDDLDNNNNINNMNNHDHQKNKKIINIGKMDEIQLIQNKNIFIETNIINTRGKHFQIQFFSRIRAKDFYKSLNELRTEINNNYLQLIQNRIKIISHNKTNHKFKNEKKILNLIKLYQINGKYFEIWLTTKKGKIISNGFLILNNNKKSINFIGINNYPGITFHNLNRLKISNQNKHKKLIIIKNGKKPFYIHFVKKQFKNEFVQLINIPFQKSKSKSISKESLIFPIQLINNSGGRGGRGRDVNNSNKNINKNERINSHGIIKISSSVIQLKLEKRKSISCKITKQSLILKKINNKKIVKFFINKNQSYQLQFQNKKIAKKFFTQIEYLKSIL
ncbi:hypothetical protein M0812_23299 [Anaeramoeba flamelloides]|uniref:Riboflavin kinase domain-containing protein n=1 Tax=Anaeramoeba flamelloides TaxID=1746091 RepID=A0AAV7YN60_9EUKA|nr:hypothetical protein M0812_23299 [Anaeramoeba flamelloides]